MSRLKFFHRFVLHDFGLKKSFPKSEISHFLSDFFYGTTHSNHLNPLMEAGIVQITLSAFLRLFVFPIAFACKNRLNANHCTIDEPVIIYIPNSKYYDYFREILPKLKSPYRIISNDEVPDAILIDSVKLISPISYIYFVYSFSVRYILKTFVLDTDESRSFLKSTVAFEKYVRWYFQLIPLFGTKKYSHFFSVYPAGDLHNFIVKSFGHVFGSIGTIRPELTGFSEEHRGIRANIIFYKSEFERQVYEFYELDKRAKLVKAGAFIEPIERRAKISNSLTEYLFLDTTLGSLIGYDKNRENGIKLSANFFKRQNNIKIYHKFHPATTPKEKFAVQNIYAELGLNVEFVQTLEVLKHIDFVIGFYSTVFYLTIVSKIPSVILRGEFITDKIVGDVVDLDLAPMLIVKSAKDIETVKRLVHSEQSQILNYADNLFNWYCSYYNYPEGLNEIIKYMEQ